MFRCCPEDRLIDAGGHHFGTTVSCPEQFIKYFLEIKTRIPRRALSLQTVSFLIQRWDCRENPCFFSALIGAFRAYRHPQLLRQWACQLEQRNLKLDTNDDEIRTGCIIRHV